jgi:uncharacterized membrane protein
MSGRQIGLVICLVALVGFSIYYFATDPESRAASGDIQIDITGLALIIGFVVIYRRFKSMQQKIDDMASDIDRLKGISSGSPSAGADSDRGAG